MEIGIKEFEELKRLGIDYEEAQKKSEECKTIRELEYSVYFGC